jgi:hypothetical protein
MLPTIRTDYPTKQHQLDGHINEALYSLLCTNEGLYNMYTQSRQMPVITGLSNTWESTVSEEADSGNAAWEDSLVPVPLVS